MMGMIDTHVSKVVTSGKEGGKWYQGVVHRSISCKFFFFNPFQLRFIDCQRFFKPDIQVEKKVVEWFVLSFFPLVIFWLDQYSFLKV